VAEDRNVAIESWRSLHSARRDAGRASAIPIWRVCRTGIDCGLQEPISHLASILDGLRGKREVIPRERLADDPGIGEHRSGLVASSGLTCVTSETCLGLEIVSTR
jgi:hypothetical protein